MKKILITLLSIGFIGAPLHADEQAGPADGKRDRKPPKGERPRGERPDFKSLTTEQRVALLKKQMKQRPKMADMLVRRFDADNNGELSDTELATAGEAIAKRGKRRGGPGGEGATPRRRGGDREGDGQRRGRGDRRGGKRPAPDAPDTPDQPDNSEA